MGGVERFKKEIEKIFRGREMEEGMRLALKLVLVGKIASRRADYGVML